jgi:hypothetical protein
MNCVGCRRDFSLGGYTKHIRHSQNPICHALYEEQLAYLPGVEEGSGAEKEVEDENHLEPDHGPIPFGGDFFGQYDEQDLNWQEDEIPPDEDGEEAEAEDDEVAEAEEDEEAEVGSFFEDVDGPIEGVHPPYHQDDSDDATRMPVDDVDVPVPRSREAASAAEDRLRLDSRHPVVEKFGLRGNAGACLDRHSNSIYRQYLEELHEPGNIWAPFTSKIDWEVARWAKLRGPGSTAVSELLNIEGVRVCISPS